MMHRPLTKAILASLLLTPGLAASQVIDLSTIDGSNGFRLLGENAADQAGTSVSGAGDINGDGIADMLVGAPAYGGASGRGYLIIGNPGADVPLTDVSAIKFTGDTNGDVAGESVTSIGDFNGDGFDDFAVGAHGVDYGMFTGSYNFGAVYVVLGSGTPTGATLPGSTIEIRGAANYDIAGSVVSGAGDVNGDGFDDLILSAPGYYDGFSTIGRDYVVFGSANPTAFDLSSINSRGFTINGDMTAPPLRKHVTGAGDFNGDGLDDLLVAQVRYGGPISSRLHIVFGKNDNAPVSLISAPGPDRLEINGSQLREARVASAGDVNGDGFADVIIGAPYTDRASPAATETGGGFVVFGTPIDTDIDIDNLSSAGFAIYGANSFDNLGRSVAGAGDVNGDGFSDVILGLPYQASPMQYSEGAAFVVFGSSFPTTVTVGTSMGSQGFAITGENNSDYAGFSVTAAGDINSDGLSDLMIGAREYGGSGAGYVVFSQENPPLGSTRVARSKNGDAPREAFGAIGDSSNAADPDGRFWINFQDGMHPFGAPASVDSASLFNSPADFSGTDIVGTSAHWQFSTNRINWTDATATIKYLDSELGALSEADLNTYVARNASGPWALIPGAVLDVNRNTATVPISGVGAPNDPFFVALGGEPEITVLDSGFNQTDGMTYPLGTQDINQRVMSQVFTIRNDGAAPLTITAVMPTNITNVANFTVDAMPMSPLASGATTVYSFSFDIVANGPFSVDVAAINNDGDENPFNQIFSGTGFGGTPEMDMFDSLAAPLADGATDAAGNTTIGATATRTFSIENNGNADLTLSSFIESNLDNVSNVTVSNSPATTIVAGSSTALEIDYDVLVDGPYSFDFAIGNDDADESPYDFTVSGNGIGGSAEIEVQLPGGAAVGDMGNDPLGNQSVGPVSRTYTIQNLGTSALTVGSVTGGNFTNVSNFTVTGPPAPMVPSGGSTTATVSFDVLANGTFGFDLDIINGDSDESPYDIAINGTGINGISEIALLDSTNAPIADGSSVNIGNQSIGATLSQTFTVVNEGSADLMISAVSANNLNNVSNFAVQTTVPFIVAPGTAAPLPVQFQAMNNGAFSLDLEIDNDDGNNAGDEIPYDLTISGNATGGVPEIELAEVADSGIDAVGNQTVAQPFTRTYTIDNLGTGALSLGTPTASNLSNVTNFLVVAAPPASIAAGGQASFTIGAEPISDGAFSMDIALLNGDSNESPYDFTVSGTGVGGTPDISVLRNAVSLIDGEIDALNEQIIGNIELSYTVRNDGAGALTIDNRSVANFDNVASFVTLAAPANTLLPGETGVFSFRFRIRSSGPFGLDVIIATNDPDEDPFEIEIRGEGTDVQVFPNPMGLIPGDRLGAAVAGSGNLYAVGIPGMDGGAGQVAIYRLDGSELLVEQMIDVPAGVSAAEFGGALAMEGDRLLIGAPGAPPANAKGPLNALQAALYERLNGQWQIKQTFVSDNPGSDNFGSAVALSGNMLIIGAPGDDTMGADAGAAYMYIVGEDGSNLISSMTVMPPNPTTTGGFGTSVAASSNGKFAAGAPGGSIGAAITGSVSMYDILGNNLATLAGSQSSANDQFGMSISMSGDLMVVGSPGSDGGATNAGSAYVFGTGGNNLVQMGQLVANSPFANSGFGQAVTFSGNGFAVGAPQQSTGAVFQFGFDFNQALLLQALAGQSGFGSALSGDAFNLLIGAPNTDFSTGAAVLQRDRSVIFANGFE